MPTNADILLDTSAAIPLVLRRDPAHVAVRERTRGLECGLAGQALYETFSVLTRLPVPHRVSPATARLIIERAFPATVALPPTVAVSAVAIFADAGIAGGADYDGLVGLAARESGTSLLSGDRRALATYARLGVPVEFV